MADLGVITTRLLQQIGRKRIDTEAGGAGSVVSLGYTATLSGTVKIGSTPVPNADVWLFNRATKLPVQRTLSAADGSFSFTNVLSVPGAHFAVAFDTDDKGQNE